MSSPRADALRLWVAFFALAVVLNGTLPWVAGLDVHSWTYSRTKGVLFDGLVYGCLFLAGPILLTKERSVVQRPGFWIPLAVGVAALFARPLFRPAALVALAALTYLHLRFDLSRLGIRVPSRWRDLIALLILGFLPLLARQLSPEPWGWSPGVALQAGLDRLFLNPASTNENLFYFGFLAERLYPGARAWTPLLVAALYTAHEMSNPEYWYEGMSFPLVFVGVAITTLVYLWSRNVVVIWLSSGLARFLTALVS